MHTPVSSLVPRAHFEKAYARLVLDKAFLEDKDYYLQRKERYRNTLHRLAPHLQPEARLLDIGGGQFALLTRELFGNHAEVADLDSRYRASIDSEGIFFHHIDLVKDDFVFETPFDVIVLAEVIGHVPVPPHIVFEKLAGALAPGGRLLVTTPNLFRLRNVIRMAFGRPIFTPFRLPEKDLPPGHFIEYDKPQLEWQMERAGMEVELSEHAQLDLGGATKRAVLGRLLASPLLTLRPVMRDYLLMVGRKPVA